MGLKEALSPSSIVPVWSVDAGATEGSSMTLLALPADQGGHQSHLAAALSANLQSLDQQKQLHADLQAYLCSIGTIF